MADRSSRLGLYSFAFDAMKPSDSISRLAEKIAPLNFASQILDLSRITPSGVSAQLSLDASQTVDRLMDQARGWSDGLAAYQRSQEVSISQSIQSVSNTLQLLGSSVSQRLADQVKLWADPYGSANSAVGSMLRQIESDAAHARLATGSLGEHFSAISRMAQDQEFLRWADQRTYPGVDLRISDWLRSLESESGDGGEPEVVARRRLAMPPMLSEFWQDPQHRVALLSLILSLLMYLQGNLSSNRDQAELLGRIEAENRARQVDAALADEKVAHFTHLVESLYALQALSHRFTVTAHKSALRVSLAGDQFDQLECGDEVLVIRKAGKWRLISVFNEDGQEIQGWMLSKHLQRVED